MIEGIDPKTVLSPKNAVSHLEIIYDEGKGSWSFCHLEWYNEPKFGIRWNGENGKPGSPQSRGIPTWFILPTGVGELINLTITTAKAMPQPNTKEADYSMVKELLNSFAVNASKK